MNGIESKSPRSFTGERSGARGIANRGLTRRCGAARFSLLLLLVVPCLASCENLIPDLDWDGGTPFGAVRIGGDENALDVVNTLEAKSDSGLHDSNVVGVSEEDQGAANSSANEAVAEEPTRNDSVLEAVAHASGAVPVVDISAEASPGSPAESSLGTPAGGDELVESKDDLAPILGDPKASIPASPGIHSEGESLSTSLGSSTEMPNAENVRPGEALDREPVEEDFSGADDLVLDGSGPGPGVLVEDSSAALKAHTSGTLTDLGFWFGRSVVTKEGRFGTVSDVRIDLAHGVAIGVVVRLPSSDVNGVPNVVVIPIEDLRDGLPWSGVLYFEPASQTTPAPATSYDELVRLAFAREEPVTVRGTVLSVESAEVEGGPPVAVVKLRDQENLLHRLDLGQMNWFEGGEELPVEGQEFEVMAVKSRDERGPLWHVASITSGESPVSIRDSAGAALRSSERAAVPSAETWSAKEVLGLAVQCRTAAPQKSEPGVEGVAPTTSPGENPTVENSTDIEVLAGEIGALAGLLMDKESKQLAYALLRPATSGDRDGIYWPVPFQFLHPGDGAGAAWELDLAFERRAELPILLEDQLEAMDAPERRAEIDAFWR